MAAHDRSSTAGGPSRRHVLRSAAALGLLGADALLPAYARAAATEASGLTGKDVDGTRVFHIDIRETPIEIGGRRATAATMNGTLPAPLLVWQEGQETVLRVTNGLREDTSIHWHGVLVPANMDGVPGLSFDGIQPGETFEYRFTPHQYGTYWYHSHSGMQEQLGHYGPLIIRPAMGPEPYEYDREHVLVLSDWTFEDPWRVLSRVQKQGGYYNYQKRTLEDFVRDVGDEGLARTLANRFMWARMRMDPTDIADVTGATYTYLLNGHVPEANWTALFWPGERVLLHVINTSSATNFDVRIPGLPMRVVQASGQYVEPVATDEFRIGVAETFNVVVEPGDRPYTIFAESMDRSGHARGTLAPREGLTAEVPRRRPRPVLTMGDMGMAHDTPGMKDMGHGAHGDMSGMEGMNQGPMPGMGHGPAPEAITLAQAGAVYTEGLRAPGTAPGSLPHERSRHGPGNAMVPDIVRSRVAEPGLGLGEDGWRVLTYADLRALERRLDFRAPTREIEMHLTGNMDRFTWSLDGVPFDRSEPLRLAFGERIRLTMVNDTMMFHPMHLHGMWMELENGHGELVPRVHTVLVKPAERLSVLISADAPGSWAFHCHIQYHMMVGMFRTFEVADPGIGPVVEGRRGW